MKIKLLSTLLLSCSFVLSFASTNLNKVNATTNETVETQQTNETVEKPDFYYSPSNEYNYQIRNDGFISPDSIEAWVRLPVASTGGTILGSGYGVLLSLNVDIYCKVGIKWNQTEVVHTYLPAEYAVIYHGLERGYDGHYIRYDSKISDNQLKEGYRYKELVKQYGEDTLSLDFK